ncbi:thiamine phosphate synthase [Maricaulaceae bacterium EIL42A08]|nr:thiamine phosphate synthase [Maricaulaceae bacterium EIL42A08]
MAELYLLTPPRIDASFNETLARTLDAGPVMALQLRLKDHGVDEVRKLAPALIQTCHQRGVSVIMNDDPKLAVELGCDGVHIGQEDASQKDARAAVGPKGIVGVTCHDSRHLAMLAGERGADYVAFGAVYETATKTPKSSAPLELFTWWRELFELPSVAIGGITPDNARPVIEAGADVLAVSGGVWNWPDGPEHACTAFSQLLD